MSIEAMYRGALRSYPARWRAEHGDAVLGVLLDEADAEGRAAADWRQLASLVGNGVAARIERIAPRRWRDLAATSTLIGTTGFALLDLLFFEWQPWAHELPGNPERWQYGPFVSLAVWALIPWLAAFVLRLARLDRLARAAFAASGIAALVISLLSLVAHQAIELHFNDMASPATLAVFLIGAPVVLAGNPSRLLHPWLQLGAAVLAGALIAALWTAKGMTLFGQLRRPDDALWIDWMGSTAGGDRTVDAWLLAFFVVVAALGGLRPRLPAAALAAALGPLSLVAAWWYLLRNGWFRWGNGWWERDASHELAALAVIACALVAGRLIALAVAPLAARLRRAADFQTTPLG